MCLAGVGGGGGTVSSDATLTGDGSSGSPLGVANNGIGRDQLDFEAGTDESNGRVVSLSGTNELGTTTLPNAPAINFNGGTPTLESGVTAAEIRSLIGVGTGGVDTFQHFDVSQVVSWFESQTAQEFSGATVAFSDPNTTITFGNNADAAQFFNDLNPSRTNGTFTSTVTLPVFQGSTPLVIVRPGATVSVSGSAVSYTHLTLPTKRIV